MDSTAPPHLILHADQRTVMFLPQHEDYLPEPPGHIDYVGACGRVVQSYIPFIKPQPAPKPLLDRKFVRLPFDEQLSADFARAARANDLTTIQNLLPRAYRINVNLLDDKEKSPLDYAIESQNVRMCELLCDHGAIMWNTVCWDMFSRINPHLKQKYHLGLSQKFTALSRTDHIDEITHLWNSSPSSCICPNVSSGGGFTPLDWSIENENIVMADFLCLVGGRSLAFPPSSFHFKELLGAREIKLNPMNTWNIEETFDWVKDVKGVSLEKATILKTQGVTGQTLSQLTHDVLVNPPFRFGRGPREALLAAIQNLKDSES